MCIHVWTYTNVYMHMNGYRYRVCIAECVWLCVFIWVFTYVYIYMYIRGCWHMCGYVYEYICMLYLGTWRYLNCHQGEKDLPHGPYWAEAGHPG